MQNRMESNIRDKFLVKMIKLQEFTEKKRIAEMLNEMNPKLKALLAAGLIGTAGLGMQSCSNPSDSVYCPYTVVAPSTDNPGSGGGTENPNPSNPDKPNPNGDNEGEIGETVDFERDLGVKPEDAERIKNATSVKKMNDISIENLQDDANQIIGIGHVYFYIKGENHGFKDVLNMAKSRSSMELIKYYSIDGDNYYYIPADMLDDFTKAGAKPLSNQ